MAEVMIKPKNKNRIFHGSGLQLLIHPVNGYEKY
jgi:hypothetical protein